MKKIIGHIPLFALMMTALPALGQEQEKPSPEKFAADHIEFLVRNLEIDEIQVFYADSIYQHNFFELIEEMESLKKKGMSANSVYEEVSDKWLDATDRALEKILTPEQWKKYLRTSFGKEKAKRDKRMAKRAETGK
ncbi:MAG: hypothetical protein KBS73_01145 [Bacteroidales bacterium]|nr:hypothetical protein [Candidatus Cacconaster equifaecalis]